MRYALIAVCAAALTATAWARVPVTQAAPAGATIQGDPQAIRELNAAREKFAALRTYRARMSMEGREIMTMEIVKPDRSRIRIAIAPNLPANEITVIGNESWTRSGNNCRKDAARQPARDDGDPTKAQGNMTVQRGGTETIDGTPAQTYLVTYVYEGQQGRQKFYVTPANGMIRRMETSNPQGTVTFDYFDYDAPITITPPC
ncbi:MAG: hypothetical protein QN178_07755 [Armatimonadota bacterium]|nr:hypothetical protein [Armatimonadota bacterium]